jgi:hypothetical protein
MTGSTGLTNSIDAFTVTNPTNAYAYTKQIYITPSTAYGLVQSIDDNYNFSIGYCENNYNLNINNLNKIQYGMNVTGKKYNTSDLPTIWQIINGMTGGVGYTGFLSGPTGTIELQFNYDG